jgi:hypothetical protein
LLVGWRDSTVDVDLRLDPEPQGIFQAIAKLKQELNINIELASLQDFLPPIPGWRDRSVFIGKRGQIFFYHYDFTAQAFSKLSRGFDRDIKDVEAMYKQKLLALSDLRNCFEAIVPELIRFPSLNPDILRRRSTRGGTIMNLNELPGAEIVLPGLSELHSSESSTIGALLVAIF